MQPHWTPWSFNVGESKCVIITEKELKYDSNPTIR